MPLIELNFVIVTLIHYKFHTNHFIVSRLQHSAMVFVHIRYEY